VFKRLKYSFSGNVEEGRENVNNDADDDDEVRVSASKNLGTATLSAEKFFSQDSVFIALPSYQQRSVGGRQAVNATLIFGPSWV
jgi:hypothetical protein